MSSLHRQVAEALGTLSGSAGRVEVVETHISYVFLAGERAYKLKKPVDLGFLDFSDVAARRAACCREVELNRRLAPTVYIGIAPVYIDAGGGVRIGSVIWPPQPPAPPRGEAARDWLVVMRRMPREARLTELLRSSAVGGTELSELGRMIAAFHERQEPATAWPGLGGLDAVRVNWEENLAQVEPLAGVSIPDADLREISHAVGGFIGGAPGLFEHRVHSGHVRDCHGDLQADDVFYEGPEAGWQVLDCIEFNDRFRITDTLCDVAFLVMDLERLGYRSAGAEFVRSYFEHTADERHEGLLAFYCCYYAFVRGKVNAMLASELGGETDRGAEALAEAGCCFDLAVLYSRAFRLRVAGIGGLPGTGKSTLAAGLSDLTGWPVISSDVVRKQLAGIPTQVSAAAGIRSGIYTEEMDHTTYEELAARAEACLGMGLSALVDATMSEAWQRDLLQDVAARHSAEAVFLECALAPEVAEERIRARLDGGGSVSDADIRVFRAKLRAAAPIDGAYQVDTGAGAAEAAATAARLLGYPANGPADRPRDL